MTATRQNVAAKPAASLSGVLLTALRRDLLVVYRHRSAWMNPLAFQVIVVTLFPLGISPDKDVLSVLAAGIVWVVALLAVLLSADNLFRGDFDDGTLEQLLLSPQPLYLTAIAKVAAHWLVTGLPLTLMTPVLAGMLHLPAAGFGVLFASLLLGTVTLSFVGAIGAALTVGLRRSGLLLSLLILPLYIPVLIFGAGAVQAAVDGFAVTGQLLVLGALLALAVTFAPFAIAAALRISVDA